MTNSQTEYDIIIIGGGAAGMMAAASAQKGKKVLLLEKNNTLGKKLLITGGGRCNVTNYQFDLRTLLKNYKNAEQFLYSAFTQFSVKDTLDFFNSRNMPTKVENEGRVFPVSDSAQSVYNVLLKEIQKNKNVTVLSNANVTRILHADNSIKGIETSHDKKTLTFKAKKYILATGGTSHPETGSTGDAYAWLQEMGHTVSKPKPSLVPLRSPDLWIKKLQGVALSDIKITLFADGQKKISKKGKILFTHFGVSGPTVLNMSKDVGDLLKAKQDVRLSLDMLPQYDHGALNKMLTEILQTNPKKKVSNILSGILNKHVVEIILQNTKIDSSLNGNAITKDMRINLIEQIKNVSILITGILDESEAVIADGGVSIAEIDFKTMKSKVVGNLYIVGDLLNIDRPSGGYSLQLCWTTGFLAGRGVV